eukprot:116705-Chlamydomonas_euryale.AAC.3
MQAALLNQEPEALPGSDDDRLDGVDGVGSPAGEAHGGDGAAARAAPEASPFETAEMPRVDSSLYSMRGGAAGAVGHDNGNRDVDGHRVGAGAGGGGWAGVVSSNPFLSPRDAAGAGVHEPAPAEAHSTHQPLQPHMTPQPHFLQQQQQPHRPEQHEQQQHWRSASFSVPPAAPAPSTQPRSAAQAVPDWTMLTPQQRQQHLDQQQQCSAPQPMSQCLPSAWPATVPTPRVPAAEWLAREALSLPRVAAPRSVGGVPTPAVLPTGTTSSGGAVDPRWSCQVCTYEHCGREAGFLRCAVCNALR